MHCQTCETDKPKAEMYNGARCQDCIRADWRRSAKRKWERARFGIERGFTTLPPQIYHGLGNRYLTKDEWKRAYWLNQFIRNDWRDFGRLI